MVQNVVVFQVRVPFRVLFFIRAPYPLGDPKRDPNLENYPLAAGLRVSGQAQGLGLRVRFRVSGVQHSLHRQAPNRVLSPRKIRLRM